MKTGEPTMSRPARQAERSRLAQRLRRVIRGEVLFDAASRGRYATDASIYQVDPVGVVVPADETDVVAALQLAGELGVPVLPRGGGTSQCGQAIGEALVIDTSRHLNRIVGFDAQARTVEVQPGIVLDRLNAQLAPTGLCFPVDVCSSAQATLGGMAGNNACGVRSMMHGNMVHNVLGIDAVLVDGTEEHFGPFGPKATRRMRSGRTGAMVSRLFEIAAREREEIERVWPRVMRRVGGYNLDVFHPVSVRPYTDDGSVNLAHLLVGSEGTLAHFRRLHLKLAPLPAHRVLGVWRFPSAVRAVGAAAQVAALGPSAVELVDCVTLAALRADPAVRPLVDTVLAGRPAVALLVEFSGSERGPILRRLRALAGLAADEGMPGAVLEVAEAELQQRLWGLHRASIEALLAGSGPFKPVSFVDDCTVPLEHLAEYVESMQEVLLRHGVGGTWYGHAGVGTLHLRPLLDLRAGDAAKMRTIAAEAGALVRRFGGAFSGEQGDGMARSEWVEREFGPRLMRAFEEVKALFDPQGLMNPGKIVRAPRMDDARLLRVLPGPPRPAARTALDWAEPQERSSSRPPLRADASGVPGGAAAGGSAGGLERAVSRCDGNGRCRGLDTGAMCPSYRATLDERDVTRGRANTLRLALAGRFGPDGLGCDEVAEAMALCVSCKACRSECPSGVDMARMKIEVLHRRAESRGLPIGERLLASLPAWAPLASRFAWLANLRDRLPGMAQAAERFLGLARRPLPRWRSETFLRAWQRDHASRPGAAGTVSAAVPAPDAEDAGGFAHPAAGPAQAAEVLLFADCFGNHFEPDNLHAAVKVLTQAGVRVQVARPAPGDAQPSRPLCCGRTYLSAGLVDRARSEAMRTVAALAPFVERGVAVVGLEPSCLLTMRDEFLALGLGDPAQRLASGAMLFEEFLVRERAAGRLALSLGTSPWKRALLHGHCHQHAFDAVGPVRQVLSWVPGLEVASVPAGCCGMGDGFGYRAAHHEVSMKMGELALLPAARGADAGTVIVSDGFGCRRQIADGAQRDALHVARVLEAALPPKS